MDKQREMQIAAASNDLAKVRALVGYQARRIMNRVDGRRWTAVFYAVVNRNFETTEFFLKTLKADPNARSIVGTTALMELCRSTGSDDSWISYLLFKHGALLNLQGKCIFLQFQFP